MTAAWVTKHRRSLTVTGIALLLILAGRFAHGGVTIRAATYGFVPWDFAFGWVSAVRLMFGCVLAIVLIQVATIILGSVRGLAGNGKASLGQGIAFSSLLWIASDKAEFDWRALKITGAILGALLVASYIPPYVWAQCIYAGIAILVGQVLGVFWTDLFTDTPAWGRYVPWLAGAEAQHIPSPERNDYWRDAKMIRKEWDRKIQDLMTKMENVGAKVKAPKLIGTPTVTRRSINLIVEPPPQWNRPGLEQLAGILTNEWNGVQSQVREEQADRMSRRRMRIDIAMEPLPTSVPYPTGDMEYGVPLGVGLMGDVLRLEVGSRGVPHVLVAGQAGSGKSSAMRVMGLGLVARGARVVCIDPKGEGDLEGISSEATLYRPAEWAEWFDFLWEEQQRRAALKREGMEPGPPIVTMIDELAQIATKMGARDKTEADQLAAAHQAYMRLIFIGRGTGLHIISATQQASAQNLGGKDQGTAIRAQHLGRVLFGRASESENRKMVLGDRLISAQDEEKMQEAPPGRAWVSGMTPRDTGLVHCVQFFDVPEMAGGGGGTVFDPVTPAPTGPIRVDDHQGSGEDRALRFLVADAVHTDGPLPRPALCDRFGVPVTTMRHTLRKCEAAGWVRCESPGGNQPVVVHPAGVWPPTDHDHR